MLFDTIYDIARLWIICFADATRFAEEDYQASLKDAFFGANSIEAWFLSRLAKVL